jgi:hypothetical protein
MDRLLGIRAVSGDRMAALGSMRKPAVVETAPSLPCTDFERMAAIMQKRLRPNPLLMLANRLRCYLGLQQANGIAGTERYRPQ